MTTSIEIKSSAVRGEHRGETILLLLLSKEYLPASPIVTDASSVRHYGPLLTSHIQAQMNVPETSAPDAALG